MLIWLTCNFRILLPSWLVLARPFSLVKSLKEATSQMGYKGQGMLNCSANRMNGKDVACSRSNCLRSLIANNHPSSSWMQRNCDLLHSSWTTLEAFRWTTAFYAILFLFICDLTLLLQDNSSRAVDSTVAFVCSRCSETSASQHRGNFQRSQECSELVRSIFFYTDYILPKSFCGSFLALGLIFIQWAECKKNKIK